MWNPDCEMPRGEPGSPAGRDGGRAVRSVLVDCGSAKVPELARLLVELGARGETVTLEVADQRPFEPTEAVVISGGPHLFTGDPSLVERFAFVDRVPGPLFGICLGHQAIALRHGASVFRGAERRGAEQVRIDGAHPLVADLGPAISLRADHCEGVTLPQGFRRLGWSAHYSVELMACDARRRYGVQCHPEISGVAGRRLLASFISLAARAIAKS